MVQQQQLTTSKIREKRTQASNSSSNKKRSSGLSVRQSNLLICIRSRSKSWFCAVVIHWAKVSASPAEQKDLLNETDVLLQLIL
jgi:hypothetical protein